MLAEVALPGVVVMPGVVVLGVVVLGVVADGEAGDGVCINGDEGVCVEGVEGDVVGGVVVCANATEELAIRARATAWADFLIMIVSLISITVWHADGNAQR